MITGSVSRMTEETIASAATISPRADIAKITGTTQIDTINGVFGAGMSQFLVLVPADGSVILGTTGNISVGITAVINRAVFLVYVESLGKWLINSGV